MDITWKQTGRERPNDGTATTDAIPGISARVYLENGCRHWYWFVNGKAAISRGQEGTKEAAKTAVEAEFHRLASRSGDNTYPSGYACTFKTKHQNE